MSFETELLSSILPTLVKDKNLIVSAGDDCAALDVGTEDLLLFASDQLISDVHFELQKTSPKDAGSKLLKRNLSDIAAMGGEPFSAVINIAQNGMSLEYLKEFFAGINKVAKKYKLSIAGGDIAGLKNKNSLVSSLTILGKVKKNKIVLRKKGKVKDLIFVTGKLGNSFESNHHLTFEPRLKEGRFLSQKGFANCMMDISDGVLLDLHRMGIASKLDAVLNLKALPKRGKKTSIKNMLTDGEDYELLFSVSPKNVEKLLTSWKKDFAKLTCIGYFSQKGNGIIFDDSNNNLLKSGKIGYEH